MTDLRRHKFIFVFAQLVTHVQPAKLPHLVDFHFYSSALTVIIRPPSTQIVRKCQSCFELLLMSRLLFKRGKMNKPRFLARNEARNLWFLATIILREQLVFLSQRARHGATTTVKTALLNPQNKIFSFVCIVSCHNKVISGQFACRVDHALMTPVVQLWRQWQGETSFKEAQTLSGSRSSFKDGLPQILTLQLQRHRYLQKVRALHGRRKTQLITGHGGG